MQKFTYKAWDAKFNIVQGVIEEEELQAAKEKLRNDGLNIIDIKQKNSMTLSFLNRKLKDEELSGFCGQMAIIINAGVNLLKGLEVLEAQTKNKRMKKIVTDIHTGVKRGKTLGKAMEDTGAFPKLLSDMVASGELTGDIDTILFNMEGFYEREATIKNKIRAASIYPAMLLSVAVGMIFFFNFFVFPDIKDLFSDSSKLPFITKVLISSMNDLNVYYIQIIIGVMLLILLLKYLSTNKKVKFWMDAFSLKLPVFSSVKKNIITARFARSMAIFMKSAVPILSILDSIKLIVGNSFIEERMEKVKDDMVNGSSIADSLEKQNIFEPMVIQMIRVGEESGRLDDSLSRLADIYDKKSETGITKLMAMIEPMFTLIVGMFVAIIILAMALPVMQMTSTLK